MPELPAPFRGMLFIGTLLLWLMAGVCAAAQAPAGAHATGAVAALKTGSGDSGSPASELFLRRVRCDIEAGRVTVDYQLGLKGLIPVRDQLREGAHMAVEGSASLLQYNLLRPNSELASVPLLWTLRHDPLTREFMLTQEETALRATHIDTLLRDGWKDLHVTLTPAEPLEADETYVVRIELALKYAEVPPWLEKALFFWSWELSPKLNYEQELRVPAEE